MWNRITSAVLIAAFTALSPVSDAYQTARLNHPVRGDDSATPSKDLPALAMASVAAHQMGLKTVFAKGLFEVVAIEFDWRSEQRTTRIPRLQSTRTLQSQHALLQI